MLILIMLFSGDHVYTCFQCAGHANFGLSPDHPYLKLIAKNLMPEPKNLTYHLRLFDINDIYCRNWN
jgi:hypothetical protein